MNVANIFVYTQFSAFVYFVVKCALRCCSVRLVYSIYGRIAIILEHEVNGVYSKALLLFTIHKY